MKAGVSKQTIQKAETMANKARQKKVPVKEDMEKLNEGLITTIIWEGIKYIARAILIILTGWAIAIVGTALFPSGAIIFGMIATGIWTVGSLVNFIYLIYGIVKSATSGDDKAKKAAIKKSIEIINKTEQDYKKAIANAKKEGASPKEIAKMQANLKKLEEKKQKLMEKLVD